MKDNGKQIKFYKGVCLEQIYAHMVDSGTTMTKKEVDIEIKFNAGFPFDSCAHKDVTTDDLGNLIVWAFLYGDTQGIFINYPEDEIDKQINLNLNE